jgi:DcuC family C4-dicarboxylate transporter
MQFVLSLVIIGAAVFAIIRKVDVRLALLFAALALATLAGISSALGNDPNTAGFLATVAGNHAAVVRTLLKTLSNEQFVVPICCAMGFAHVLLLTGCDQHLVHLLIRPLRRVRIFLIPGAVLVGFLVNIPVISQTSTAVAVGTLLVPLMLAARVSPLTTGAALLLGASLGGELLNPGAPELRTVSTALEVTTADCVSRVIPLLMVQLGVATVVFWVLSVRAEAHKPEAQARDDSRDPSLALRASVQAVPQTNESSVGPNPEQAEFRVNLLKAAVPLLPVVLLFLTILPLNSTNKLLPVPEHWLVQTRTTKELPKSLAKESDDVRERVLDMQNAEERRPFNSRLIGAAMLIGVVAAAFTNRRTAGATAKAFFEGAGYAFAQIISLIAIATCFGEAVKLVKLDEVLGNLIATMPGLLLPSAGALPLAFAWISGSGMAATQSLFGFFVEPSAAQSIAPTHVGAIVSIGAAAGRTMSPVAAVTLMTASLTKTNPFDLAKRVAIPLLAGMVAVVIVGMFIGQR